MESIVDPVAPVEGILKRCNRDAVRKGFTVCTMNYLCTRAGSQ